MFSNEEFQEFNLPYMNMFTSLTLIGFLEITIYEPDLTLTGEIIESLINA